MIAYGATVETVHSHGHVTPRHTDAASICDSGGSQSSHTGHSHNRECSMCQFQQQLFNGLVHSPLSALSPSAQMAFAFTPIAFCPSTSSAPQSNRGPPLGLV